MINKRRKKNHFVPKVLQKAFCSNNGHLWYSERGEDGRFLEPKDRNTESTFRIKDYYTILDENDNLSDSVESLYYGQLDNYLGEILPKLYRSLRRGIPPVIEGRELSLLQQAVWAMIKRTPDFIKTSDDLEIGRIAIEGILRKSSEISDPERSYTLRKYLDSETKVRQYGRNIRVRGSLQSSIRVDQALQEFSVRWVNIPGKQSFILSAMIAYRIGNGGPNGLSNPNFEIWFPISPKFALVLLRDKAGRIPLLVNEDRDRVRLFNEYAAINSSAVASHSRELVESLIEVGGIL